MVGLDEGALICDFAETYHVLNWRALPARTAATLAMGLGPDSRIVRKMAGVQTTVDTMLLAMIADALRILVWQNTEDGVKGQNKPAMITDRLTNLGSEPLGFDSADEFRRWRSQILGSESDGC